MHPVDLEWHSPPFPQAHLLTHCFPVFQSKLQKRDTIQWTDANWTVHCTGFCTVQWLIHGMDGFVPSFLSTLAIPCSCNWTYQIWPIRLLWGLQDTSGIHHVSLYIRDRTRNQSRFMEAAWNSVRQEQYWTLGRLLCTGLRCIEALDVAIITSYDYESQIQCHQIKRLQQGIPPAFSLWYFTVWQVWSCCSA